MANMRPFDGKESSMMEIFKYSHEALGSDAGIYLKRAFDSSIGHLRKTMRQLYEYVEPSLRNVSYMAESSCKQSI